MLCSHYAGLAWIPLRNGAAVAQSVGEFPYLALGNVPGIILRRSEQKHGLGTDRDDIVRRGLAPFGDGVRCDLCGLWRRWFIGRRYYALLGSEGFLERRKQL